MTGSIENVTVTGVANFKGTVIGITAEMTGLGNVDNTSDVDKPISSVTQSALGLKANVADLNLKANTSDLNLKANTSDLNLKANVADLNDLKVKFENLIKILTRNNIN